MQRTNGDSADLSTMWTVHTTTAAAIVVGVCFLGWLVYEILTAPYYDEGDDL